jgi:hypothetical protein
MVLIISTLCAAVFLAVVQARRLRDRREMERHNITPEALHALLASSQGGRGHNKGTITVTMRASKRQKEPSIALIFYKLPLSCALSRQRIYIPRGRKVGLSDNVSSPASSYPEVVSGGAAQMLIEKPIFHCVELMYKR